MNSFKIRSKANLFLQQNHAEGHKYINKSQTRSDTHTGTLTKSLITNLIQITAT